MVSVFCPWKQEVSSHNLKLRAIKQQDTVILQNICLVICRIALSYLIKLHNERTYDGAASCPLLCYRTRKKGL